MPDQDLLGDLLDRLEPAVRRAAARMFEDLRRSFTVEDIEQLLRSGDVTSAVLAVLDELFGGLSAALVDAYEESGNGAALLIGAPFVFDRLTDRGVGRLRSALSGLHGVLREAQRSAILEAYAESLAAGSTSRQQASRIRLALGLNAAAARNLSTYVRGLSSRRTEPGSGLTASAISRMAQAFSANLRRSRYVTIAEAETLAAINMAAFEAFSQAEDQGVETTKEWVTRGDSHVRPSHVGLSGVVRALHETFRGLDGDLMFPGDPAAPASERVRCRCHLRYRRLG